MTTTFSAYAAIAGNLPRWGSLTAQTPAVKSAVAAYEARIGDVKSIDDFLRDRRVFAFAMTAYGLADKIDAKALMRKVLEGGVDDAKSLAHTLTDSRILAFAKAFDFHGKGAAAVTAADATQSVTTAYVRQALEAKEGASDKGVQLALYFARKAPDIKSVYDVLADKNLLTVVQTTLGISPMTAAQSVDRQAANLKKALVLADFSDPAKLQSFINRFAAQYDISNAQTAAATGGVGIGVDLMVALQGFRPGGV